MGTIYLNAARFVNSVMAQADNQVFDRESVNGLALVQVIDSAPNSSETHLDKLPGEIRVQTCPPNATFTEWATWARLLVPPLKDSGKESERQTVAEVAAADKLKEMSIERDLSKTALDQLLEYIFQQAFTPTVENQKLTFRGDIIGRAVALTPQLEEKLPFQFWRLRYKVESFIANIVGNPLVQIGMIFLLYRVGRWAQPRIYFHLKNTAIPRAAHLTMKHAPVAIIPLISRGIQLVEWTTRNYWKATLAFMGLKWVTNRALIAHRAVVIIEKIAFLPTTIAEYLFLGPYKVFSYAWDLQSGIKKKIYSVRDGSRAEYFARGGVQAYRVWMDLMKNGARANIFTPNRPIGI